MKGFLIWPRSLWANSSHGKVLLSAPLASPIITHSYSSVAPTPVRPKLEVECLETNDTATSLVVTITILIYGKVVYDGIGGGLSAKLFPVYLVNLSEQQITLYRITKHAQYRNNTNLRLFIFEI